LLRTTPAPAPVALRAPSVGAGLPVIPCSVIHSNFWDINSETAGVTDQFSLGLDGKYVVGTGDLEAIEYFVGTINAAFHF